MFQTTPKGKSPRADAAHNWSGDNWSPRSPTTPPTNPQMIKHIQTTPGKGHRVVVKVLGHTRQGPWRSGLQQAPPPRAFFGEEVLLPSLFLGITWDLLLPTPFLGILAHLRMRPPASYSDGEKHCHLDHLPYMSVLSCYGHCIRRWRAGAVPLLTSVILASNHTTTRFRSSTSRHAQQGIPQACPQVLTHWIRIYDEHDFFTGALSLQEFPGRQTVGPRRRSSNSTSLLPLLGAS